MRSHFLRALPKSGSSPVFRSASFAATGTAAVNFPAGHASGDLLVLVTICNSATIVSTPAGWTATKSQTTGAVHMYMYHKIDSGSEPGSLSYSWSVTDTKAVTYMLAYSGVNATPLDTTSTVATAAASSISTNTLTTTAANDLVISLFGSDLVGDNWSTPAGTTSRVTSKAGSLEAMQLVDEIKTTAGTTTARSISSSGTNLCAFSAAFKAA